MAVRPGILQLERPAWVLAYLVYFFVSLRSPYSRIDMSRGAGKSHTTHLLALTVQYVLYAAVL